jgi:two-component system response regulator HydG
MLDILVVDDDDIVRQSVSEALAGAGHRVAQANDGEHAISLFARRAFDVAVCDVHMPRMDGLTLCRRLRRESPGTALVLMTSYGIISDAVSSLRGGVVDYVSKPFDPGEFAANVVGPIAERHALRKKFEETRSELLKREAGASLVGASLVMRQLQDRIAVAASTDASVLVTGERGSGKKLVARAIHAESPRREGPLVVVPCEALPDLTLCEGLVDVSSCPPRDTWFRAASGGTLVLDGVECLSASAATTLAGLMDQPTLHARRHRDWQPLGVRVISLSTEDAPALAERAFLQPLRMRLDGLKVRVPPLRDREGDLYLLVCHLLRELTPPAVRAPGLTPRAWRALTTHPFRDNVRELAWVLERALALSRGGEIDVEHLPEEVTEACHAGTARDPCRTSPW